MLYYLIVYVLNVYPIRRVFSSSIYAPVTMLILYSSPHKLAGITKTKLIIYYRDIEYKPFNIIIEETVK